MTFIPPVDPSNTVTPTIEVGQPEVREFEHFCTVETRLPAAARTTSPAQQVLRQKWGGAAWVFIRITASPNNTETITPKLSLVDGFGGTTLVHNFPAITANAITTPVTLAYGIWPGASTKPNDASSNLVELLNFVLPGSFALDFTHSGSSSWTYGVEVHYNLES